MILTFGHRVGRGWSSNEIGCMEEGRGEGGGDKNSYRTGL